MTTSKRTPTRHYMAGMVHCAQCRGVGWVPRESKFLGGRASENEFRVCPACRGKGKIKA